MARKPKAKASLSKIASSFSNYLNDTEIIPTNIFILDHILKGGLETGTSLQLLAESGTGKTTIALYIAKNICEQKKNVLYIDTESSVSKEIISSVGLSKFLGKQFIYVREFTFDNVEKVMDECLTTGEVSLVVIDSLAGLINAGFTNTEKGISITTNSSMYISRPLTLFMNKYKALASAKNFSLLVVNQFRNRVDSIRGTLAKEYGTKAVKYNSDIILKVSPIKATSIYADFKNLTTPLNVGTGLEFEIVKSNKNAPEEKYPFYLVYGKGVDDLLNIIYALVKLEIIKKLGTYYSFSTDRFEAKEQGIKNFYNLLCDFEFNTEDVDFNQVIDFYNSINKE